MDIPRRRVLAAGLGTACVLLLWLALGPLVRLRAARAFRQRGVEAQIGRVWVGWFSAHLRTVHVESVEGDWLRADLPRVDVDVTALLGIQRIRIEGGEISLRGAPDELRRRLRGGPEREGNATKRSSAGPDFSINALRVRWSATDSKRGALEVEGVSAERTRGDGGESGQFHADVVSWSGAGMRAGVHALMGRFGRSQPDSALQLQELRAGPADVSVSVGEALGSVSAEQGGRRDDTSDPPSHDPGSASSVDTLMPPALPPAGPPPAERSPSGGRVSPGGRSASGKSPSSRAAGRRPQSSARSQAPQPLVAALLPPPSPDPRAFARVERLRDNVVSGAAWVTEHVSASAEIELSGLNLVVGHRDQHLNIGPATLRMAPRGQTVELDLRPGSSQPTTSPLRVHAELPARQAEMVLRVEGGPVTLASLGVHENDFGLLDVSRALVEARTTLTVSSDAHTVSFEGDGKFASLSVVHRKLAREPVRGIELGFRTRGALQTDGSLIKVDDGELALGGIRLTGSGLVEHGLDYVRLDTRIDVPTSDCQRMFASIPAALVPKLGGLQMAGTFALKTSLQVDTRRPEDIEVDWQLANRCRITAAPADIRADRFRRPFQHIVYDEHDRKVPILTGPGAADWIPLRAITPYLEASVTTTEDGGFRNHGGFDKTAIKNSIRDDLRTGKFLRGASTITMQVAKNLYLEREKSLSRKLQEAVLTMYLEQAFTKDEILELYFNIVEFGPMVYGVGQAAEYYFHTTPFELSLGQALFLSSILPSPKRTYFGADGQLGKGWSGYLRRVMKIMRDRNRITDQELAEGLSETLVLHSPKPLRSQPTESDRGGSWLAPDAAP